MDDLLGTQKAGDLLGRLVEFVDPDRPPTTEFEKRPWKGRDESGTARDVTVEARFAGMVGCVESVKPGVPAVHNEIFVSSTLVVGKRVGAGVEPVVDVKARAVQRKSVGISEDPASWP